MEVYSNGKVLLTGEYVILDGALSLAAPTKFGQHLKYQENLSNLINWKSINFDGNIWFECLITSDTLKVKSTSSKKISNKLVEIINFIREYNPSFLKKCGSDITTNLTFEKNLGLGSSSTLISNLSKISGVNPYTLNNKIFKGSGYVIACAESISPILYKLDKDQKIINKDFSVPDSEVKTSSSRGKWQNYFRNSIILPNYQFKCAITGITTKSLLTAAHILRWADHKDKRIDPQNGICLSKLVDQCFENNLIFIDDNYKLQIREETKKKVSEALKVAKLL